MQQILHKTTLCAVLFVSIFSSVGTHADDAMSDGWVQSWGASPEPPRISGNNAQPKTITSRTLLQRFHISAGGHAVRLKLSNAWGKQPLRIEAASVLVVNGESHPEPIKLTFGGLPYVNIPPGAPALSDAVALDAPALSEIEVRLFISKATAITTVHYMLQPSSVETGISEQGDYTDKRTVPISERLDSYAFLSGMEIHTPEPVNTIVAFGDSITNGLGPNRSWPSRLADRLSKPTQDSKPASIVNAGIGGNMLLNGQGSRNALARFDRDVLATTGITHIIVLLGLNDIGWRNHLLLNDGNATIATAAEIISSYQQLIQRAHAKGVKIYGSTLTPFSGAEKKFSGYYTPEGEEIRQAVNHWIRTSGEFDAVIDFDKALQNPDNPSALLPEYDSGDHLHPSDAGALAMARAIAPSLFTSGTEDRISSLPPAQRSHSSYRPVPVSTKPRRDTPPQATADQPAPWQPQ